MAHLSLHDVAVSRGGRPLLHGLDLVVESGERLALLGASGAGKTTLLRAIAGTHPLDRGTILLDGSDIEELPDTERGMAFVPQSAGLLPHRDVSGNIGFPLEVRRVRRDELLRRVRAQARAFALSRIMRRSSTALSAGETAEVALARSLVHRPRLLLLDEPFARIGGPGRRRLIRDLLEMQEGYGSTLLIATNDPRLAEQVAPRIAVLADGGIVQVGAPIELVRYPATLDVLWLLAHGTVNLLPGQLVTERGTTRVQSGPLTVPTWDPPLRDLAPAPVQVALRPSDLHLDGPDSAPSIAGRVVDHVFLGDVVDVTIATEDAQLLVRRTRPAPRIGEHVRVTVPPSAVHLFDGQGRALAHGV